MRNWGAATTRRSGGRCSGWSRCTASTSSTSDSPGCAARRSRAGTGSCRTETFAIVKSAATYLDQLRHHHVLADRTERATTMMERVAAAAKAAGGTYDPEASLVDENASLVEEPHVVTRLDFKIRGDSSRLPAEVRSAPSRARHQKYFCVRERSTPSSSPSLLPSPSPTPRSRRRRRSPRGTTTMRAWFSPTRGSSSRRTRRRSSRTRVAKLTLGIVFHNKLGTLREKIARVERLAGWLAREARDERGRADADVKRAAHLYCKSDYLVISLMLDRRVPRAARDDGADVRASRRRSRRPSRTRSATTTGRSAPPTTWLQGDAGSRSSGSPTDSTRSPGCFGDRPRADRDGRPLRAATRLCIGDPADAARKGALRRSLTTRRDPRGGVRWVRATGPGRSEIFPKMETVAKVEAFTAERLRGLLASETGSGVADAVMGSGHNVRSSTATAPTPSTPASTRG